MHLSATSDSACLPHIEPSVLGKVGAQGQAWIYVEHMLLAIDGEHEELVVNQLGAECCSVQHVGHHAMPSCVHCVKLT